MKKYDNYKDSGIEWVGDIPEMWSYSALKWYALIYSGGTPSKDIEDYWINGTIPWLNSGSVNQGDVTEASEFITEEALKKSSAKWVPNDSLIMALAGQGKTKGMVAQVKFDTTCNQSLGVIVPNEKIDNRYLLYWLRNNYQNIRNLGGGDKRDGLNLVMLGSIPIPIPILSEQKLISNFLDHKTSQIDHLIAKKEQFIKLLEEERVAVINQAVTKGLDSNVPMKDAGVEWLGEIPEHWEVSSIKFHTKIQNGSTPSSSNEEFWNGDVNWVTTDDLGKLEDKNICKTRRTITKLGYESCGTTLAPIDSIVISTRAPIGHIGILKIEASTNQGCKTIIPKSINSLTT